jgi:hypothetical protein
MLNQFFESMKSRPFNVYREILMAPESEGHPGNDHVPHKIVEDKPHEAPDPDSKDNDKAGGPPPAVSFRSEI